MRRARITLMFFAATLAQANAGSVRLNDDAVRFAGDLIAEGRIVADRHKDWRSHQPSASQKNGFILAHGFAEYAKWHLAIDESHPAETKAHYKFPFGDFARVHRCGLLALKARARQYGYSDIEAAAEQLLTAIERVSRHRPSAAEFGLVAALDGRGRFATRCRCGRLRLQSAPCAEKRVD